MSFFYFQIGSLTLREEGHNILYTKLRDKVTFDEPYHANVSPLVILEVTIMATKWNKVLDEK